MMITLICHQVDPLLGRRYECCLLNWGSTEYIPLCLGSSVEAPMTFNETIRTGLSENAMGTLYPALQDLLTTAWGEVCC